jgi:hypothetical protein
MKRVQLRASSFWYFVFALVAGCAVFVMARQNLMTFPRPWNDEARFYLPSWYFSETGSLAPKILNAPNGIYWVPDGFYIWLGTSLALFGRSITVARLVCEISVASSVSIFAFSFLKITRSATMAVLCTLMLVTPPVIFAANMVRMEAPLCLLFALAIWSHLKQFYLSAASLLLLSLLVHPALALALPAYLLALAATRSGIADKDHQPWKNMVERTLLILVLLALLAEIARVAMHFSLFQHHMSYQVSQKVSPAHWKFLTKPQGIVLGMEIAAVLVWFVTKKRKIFITEQRLLVPIAAAVLGLQVYAVLGGLTSYDVYSLSIGPALFFCLAYRVLFASSTAFGTSITEGVALAGAK